MLGALIGDTVGSRFEWNNYKGKDFELFTNDCRPTDDSVMTLAIAEAVLKSGEDLSLLPQNAVECMRRLGRAYPYAGYGGKFAEWLLMKYPRPYGSYGNGAAMRVSPVGFAGRNLAEVKVMSEAVTKVTHSHFEGLKGAEATSVAVYLARKGHSKAEIRKAMEAYYPLNFTLGEIRPSYRFDETCQGSVPIALEAFFESDGFEDAIRNAVSIGGDSDTIAAITGGIAEVYYGIPEEIRKKELEYLDMTQIAILDAFEKKYGTVPLKKRRS